MPGARREVSDLRERRPSSPWRDWRACPTAARAGLVLEPKECVRPGEGSPADAREGPKASREEREERRERGFENLTPLTRNPRDNE